MKPSYPSLVTALLDPTIIPFPPVLRSPLLSARVPDHRRSRSRSRSRRKGEAILSVECFTFSLVMLPSINEKHKLGKGGKGTHVEPAYRKRELQEVARIAYQRDLVGWTPPGEEDRYGILYHFTFPTPLKRDLHNPLKATCDILGAGRYESLWRKRKRERIWVPHAQMIQNDNRVLEEHQIKEVCPGPIQWATIHLLRCPHHDLAPVLIAQAMCQLLQERLSTLLSTHKDFHYDP